MEAYSRFLDIRKNVLSECDTVLQELVARAGVEREKTTLADAALRLRAIKEILTGESVFISSLRGLCFSREQGYVKDICPNGKSSIEIKIANGIDNPTSNSSDLHTHIDLYVDPTKEKPGEK